LKMKVLSHYRRGLRIFRKSLIEFNTMAEIENMTTIHNYFIRQLDVLALDSECSADLIKAIDALIDGYSSLSSEDLVQADTFFQQSVMHAIASIKSDMEYNNLLLSTRIRILGSTNCNSIGNSDHIQHSWSDCLTAFQDLIESTVVINGLRDFCANEGMFGIESKRERITMARDIHSLNKFLEYEYDKSIPILLGREEFNITYAKTLINFPLCNTPSQPQIKALAIANGQLYSGGTDNCIHCYDIETLKEITSLRGHVAPITCITIEGMKLFSSVSYESIEGCIIVWNIHTNSQIGRIHCGHENGISCLYVSNNILYGGGSESILMLWNATTLESMGTIQDDISGSILSIYVEGNRIYAACSDHAIRIFDGEHMSRLRTIPTSPGTVSAITVDKGNLFAVLKNGILRCWDIVTFQLISECDSVHKSALLSISVFGNKIYAGAYDGTINVWKRDNMKRLSSIKCHNETVNCIVICKDACRLYSGSDDTTIIESLL
jgi:WD40 repeat protein